MIKFTKMEGLGNDYVYIYSDTEIENVSSLAIKISDRHFGIGSDGLILIMPSDVADFKMRIYNADGSQAEMCGNGIRCVGKYIYDNKLSDKLELDIETLAGIKHVSLIVDDNHVTSVKVDMGVPIFDSKLIPVNLYEHKKLYNDIDFVQVGISVNNSENLFTCVSMGNPHAVCFLENISDLDIEKYGPLAENDKRFPNRVNAEFVEVIDRNMIKMRVWERGAQETLACGTGACAAVCASILNGYTDNDVEVLLLGGTLKVEWAADGHVYMTGPAVTVYEGVYNNKAS